MYHRMMYGNYSTQFDWYLKADDDVYIIMENLKHFLSQLNPNKPVYIGGRSLTLLKHGYNGGGAGLYSWKDVGHFLYML